MILCSFLNKQHIYMTLLHFNLFFYIHFILPEARYVGILAEEHNPWRGRNYMSHSLHVDKWMSCIGLRTVRSRCQTNYSICSRRIQFHSLLRIACGSGTIPQNALPMFHTKNSSNFGLISLLEMQVRLTLGFDLQWTECRLRQYKAFSRLLLKV